MVRSRFEIVVFAACAVLLAGCASSGGGAGGGGGGEGGGAAAGGGGARPRDTGNTNTATFLLAQAEGAEDAADRYRSALEAALRAVDEGPGNPLGYLLAGRAYIGLGQHLPPDSMITAYLAADSMLTRAEDLYPTYLEETGIDRENAWINLFNAAIGPLDSGETAQGIELLETAEAVFVGMRPEALFNLGITYGNEGRYDEAVDAYGSMLEVVRGPRMEEVDSTTAASWMLREQAATYNRANILSRAERYDEAAATYAEYLESNPDDVQALSGLAGALASSGQADSAQAIYNTLLDADGLGISDYMDIGVGLYRSAQTVDTTVVNPRPIYAQAARAFRAVVDISPRSRDGVFNLGQSLAEAQEWEALVPVSEQLIELDPYNPQTYLLRALALNGVGQQEEAIEIYEQSDSLDFTLDGYTLTPRTGGGGAVSAMLANNSLDPGTTLEIRAHFSGEDGNEIGTVDIRVDAPPQGSMVAIEADLSSGEVVTGYYLEVLSPR